jgi:malonate-semialdehyde dehydrogenase (acetylating) / methylmalonate-semialdehyde dehydrogenase
MTARSASSLPLLSNFIAGRWLVPEGSNAIDLPDPSTGATMARVPRSGVRGVDAAVIAARTALPEWRETPVAARCRILARFRERLEAAAPDLIDRIVRENGKTPAEAEGSLRRGVEATEFALSAPTLLQGSSLENVTPGVDTELLRAPVGVVAGITPFNFPVMIPLWMAPLALACGNTFLLKPSERAPLSAQRLAELFESAGVPPGVFNLVHGSAETVNAILEHPGVDAVAFVGSAPVARHVYTRAAASGKRVLALAGAKNHLVVLPDADLERAVASIISSAFGQAGERCLAGSIVLAVGSVGDPLVAALASAVRALRVGPSDAAGTEVGPLIRSDHRERVREHIRRGESEGAVVAARGHAPEGPGYFEAPVLFDHVRPDMSIAQQEIFGPVLSVVRVASLDEAIGVANASPFGNAAAIFTRDGRSAREFRHRIEAGMVGVNLGVPAPPAYFPFVGWKGSVNGDLAATGKEAVAFYTRTKVVLTRWT